jgi:hypothetical protein
MIDEACLLAGIEVFEQPSICIDMAAKTVEDQRPHNQILVLQLTYYGLDIYHRQMGGGAVYAASSMGLNHLGTHRFYRTLAERVVQASNDASYADEKVAWVLRFPSRTDVIAAYKARWKLGNNRFWDDNLDFELRMVDLNLTNAPGDMREFTLRGKEIIDVEQEYSSLMSDAIETFLRDCEATSKYQKKYIYIHVF